MNSVIKKALLSPNSQSKDVSCSLCKNAFPGAPICGAVKQVGWKNMAGKGGERGGGGAGGGGDVGGDTGGGGAGRDINEFPLKGVFGTSHRLQFPSSDVVLHLSGSLRFDPDSDSFGRKGANIGLWGKRT